MEGLTATCKVPYEGDRVESFRWPARRCTFTVISSDERLEATKGARYVQGDGWAVDGRGRRC